MEENTAAEASHSVNDEVNVADNNGANKENSNDVINVSDAPVENQNTDNVAETNKDTLKELENVDPATIPDEFSEEELQFYQKLQAEGHPAVQFQRIHCTGCNDHLGSAPINQSMRYIHPLLKVMLCKQCYDFYCSGEFDKDEDGSELYCRWCGEGGNVLCCAQCPYVFCKKCIRKNLGKKKLEEVKESDDWLCFVCVPSQLINLRINCRALYEYSLNEIKYSKIINNPEILKIDHTLCCQKKPKPPQPKRKRPSSPDVTYDPYLDKIMETDAKKKKTIINNLKQKQKHDDLSKETINQPQKIWNTQEEDEVVCTPDLSLFMEDEEPETASVPGSSDNDLQIVNENNIHASVIPKPPLATPAAKKIYTISPSPLLLNSLLPKPNITNTAQVLSTLTSTVTPTIKFTNNVVGNGQSVITVTHNLKKASASTRLMPGLKHDWFDRAMHLSARVNQSLSTRLTKLSSEQNAACTLEELASVHNRLQEILSSSINSLIQIRKNLRNEFLDGLNKLKFTSAPPENPPSGDDDDVILVEESDNKSPEQQPNKPSDISNNPSDNVQPSTPLSSIVTPSSGQYLKVKPISKLVNSEEPIEIIDEVVSKTEKEEDPKTESSKNDEVTENNITETSKNDEVTETVLKEGDIAQENPGDELQEIDENLNPEVLNQIKQAIEQSKLEKMLHDNNIPAEELKKMLSVKVILRRMPLEAIATTRRAKPIEEKKEKKVQEIQEDIEQLLETSIVHKTPADHHDSSSNGSTVDVEESEHDRTNNDEIHSDDYESSDEDETSETDNECEENHKEDSRPSSPQNTSLNNEAVNIQEKSKQEEASNDPHTVDSGIDVECDRRVDEVKTGKDNYNDDDVSSISSREDKDKDFRMSFASEVECDA